MNKSTTTVSYTHLDVYKRQEDARGVEVVAKERQAGAHERDGERCGVGAVRQHGEGEHRDGGDARCV